MKIKIFKNTKKQNHKPQNKNIPNLLSKYIIFTPVSFQIFKYQIKTKFTFSNFPNFPNQKRLAFTWEGIKNFPNLPYPKEYSRLRPVCTNPIYSLFSPRF